VSVCGLGIRHLVRLNEPLFLAPAFVNAVEAPAGAAFRGADWFVTHHRENRIRVGRRKYTQSHPTAPADLGLEFDRSDDAVG